MCIVTGPRIDLAIALLDKVKKLFATGKNPITITFDTKETVIELNGVKIEAFPSHHLDVMRGLPNLRLPVDFRKPYASAFILSDASSKDLTRLGIKVRSQAGDIFSAFVPLSTIPKLEASSAIRFIELARPLFTTLNQAIPDKAKRNNGRYYNIENNYCT
jgi:hypothetical protein